MPVTSVAIILESGKHVRHANLLGLFIVFTDMQNGEERLPECSSTLPICFMRFTFFCFAAVFLTTDIAAVALRQHVLRNCFTVERHNMRTNRRLNRDIKTADVGSNLSSSTSRDHGFCELSRCVISASASTSFVVD